MAYFKDLVVVDRGHLVSPEYGPLVATCAAYGIRRSAAFALVRDGHVRTFTIGRKRFVLIADLRGLPEVLAKVEAGAK